MNEKILIIDDEQTMHVVLKHMLKDRFDILHADSAQEGIDILSNERVDLVLSDIHMPGMSGIEFLESLQLDAEHHNIPFLIITGQPSTEKEEKAMNLGAADFIDKSLIGTEREKLVDRISMKILSGNNYDELEKSASLNAKRLGKKLISDSLSGDFFSTSRLLCLELRKSFGFDYITFWTVFNNNLNLIMSLGEVQNTSYGAENLKKESTFQNMLEKREPYMYNHLAENKEGIMAEFSKKHNLPAEIGIPLFAIDEKTYLKNNRQIPDNVPIFGVIFLKRNKLYSTNEFNVIRKLFIQAGTILWRLYKQM